MSSQDSCFKLNCFSGRAVATRFSTLFTIAKQLTRLIPKKDRHDPHRLPTGSFSLPLYILISIFTDVTLEVEQRGST